MKKITILTIGLMLAFNVCSEPERKPMSEVMRGYAESAVEKQKKCQAWFKNALTAQ